MCYSRNVAISIPRLLSILVLVLICVQPATGKVFKLLANQIGFFEENSDMSTAYLAPAGSQFEILHEDTNQYIVRFRSVSEYDNNDRTTLYMSTIIPSMYFGGDSPERLRIAIVDEGVNYRIEKSSIPDYNYQLESGFEYGILTVPYKLQLADGSITAAASLGPFVGYRQRWIFGLPTTLLLSGGLTLSPIQDINSSTVETKIGITGASGLVFNLNDDIQIGFILGFDHFGGSTGESYEFENKVWSSVSLGFPFIQ